MDLPNFYALDPENTHTCHCCQNAIYDIAIHHIRCPKLKIFISKIQYVSPNDCVCFKSMWLNDFKHQQATGKGYITQTQTKLNFEP